MPLRFYKCPLCKKVRESLRKSPRCNHNQDEEGTPLPVEMMKEVIKAPNGKFMECANASTGKSKPKDMQAALTERARNHTRDTLGDDTIQLNKDNKLGVQTSLLNEKGERRRKIDDI